MRKILDFFKFFNPFYKVDIPKKPVEPEQDFEEYHNPYLGIDIK